MLKSPMIQPFSLSSMVAEIGGYSGLLIGFSILDFAIIVKKCVSFIRK